MLTGEEAHLDMSTAGGKGCAIMNGLPDITPGVAFCPDTDDDAGVGINRLQPDGGFTRGMLRRTGIFRAVYGLTQIMTVSNKVTYCQSNEK